MLKPAKLQRLVYSLFFYLAVPVLLLRLLWRSMKNPGYRQHIKERFGFVPHQMSKQPIWLHAVSLGETIAATPLIKALLKRYPQSPLIITSTTPTGRAQVHKAFKDQVINYYLPYDLPDCVARFLRHIHPKIGIIIETELWPNLLTACQQRHIPMILTNARLSHKSYLGYHRVATISRDMMQALSHVCSQAHEDGQRFIDLGLEPKRMTVSGNIKFDLELADDLIAKGQALRNEWGENRPVWLVASTHEGEEAMILQAFNKVQQQFPNALLALVPRHPERFNKIAFLCKEQGFTIAHRSQSEAVQAGTAIMLGDTMGELMLLFAASDLTFVGGSLVPIGGHNLIEPAALGLAILTGPHLHNFTEVSKILIEAQACKVLNDQQAIAEAVIDLFANPSKCRAMGQRALTVVTKNSGAVTKQLQVIDSMMTRT